MNSPTLNFTLVTIAAASTIGLLILGCSSGQGLSAKPGSFASMRLVIEANCAHCHGDARLPNMPAFNDTRAIANLTGSGKWIIPGHPERSRFFQVMTFSDEQPGAMPPTGHAVSKKEAETIRAWILSGATLPEGSNIKFIPRGDGPHSQ